MKTFYTSRESRVLVVHFRTCGVSSDYPSSNVIVAWSHGSPFLTKGQLTSSLSKLWDNLAFNSKRFPKITAYLTCSLVFKDVHGRSGGVCRVFQSHTLEQLGVSKDVRVTSDHGMFEENLKKHLSNEMFEMFLNDTSSHSGVFIHLNSKKKAGF